MRLLRLIAAFALTLSFAAPVYAAPIKTGCDCWCTSSEGATGGTSADHVVNRAACDTLCQGKGQKVITCSTSPSEVPSNNPRCFDSEASCKTTCDGPPVPNKQPSGYIYDSENQPPECQKGAHYCYCTGESYKLAFEIPGQNPGDPAVAKVTDIGAYVNTVYKFLLGFGITVAIVMVMIGGLQYVLAAGGGNVKQAKERIQNAVVGLILLFCAALILQSVNPRLLTLQPPRLAAIKRVDTIEPGSDCASFVAPAVLGKDATNGKKCGSKETVVKDKKGNPAPAGTVCTWKTCGGAGEGCFVAGDIGYCLKCGDVVPNNADVPVTPSPVVCKSLALPSKDPVYNYCFWTRDPYALFGFTWSSTKTALKAALGITLTVGGGMVAGPPGAALGAIATTSLSGSDGIALMGGTCAALTIDCSNITKCEGYNKLEITNKIASDSDLQNISSDWGEIGMQTICTNNPCKNKIGYSCRYIASSNTCADGTSACSADSDCTQGYTCNLTVHTCTQLHSCRTDMDCVASDKCFSGTCITPNPNAGKNGQSCKLDGTCDAGITCVTTNATLSVKLCSDGTVGAACATIDDCAGSNTCVNNKCAAPGSKLGAGQVCSGADQCASGICAGTVKTCLTGDETTTCATFGGSGDDSKCLSNYYCPDVTMAKCTPKKGGTTTCTQNKECLNGTCVGNNTDFVGSPGKCN